MLKVLDLFSGIGGFSLGLERTGGFETVAFCEIDKKARAVLAKHWPDVPIFDDVCTLTQEALNERAISVDVVCGGFPCQDLSLAGRGAGLDGQQSGLWFEYHRIIAETRPSWVIIENVPALRSRGLDRVLWSLAEIGYDAEWHCIPASAVGAPHRRDRIWIVANAMRESLERQWKISIGTGEAHQDTSDSRWWAAEPDVGRMAYGVPGRVDRIKQLGNSVVPQIPEMIGRAILAVEQVRP
jgi:DNA (cytosine-5)-methyltransferase 1